jgi:serine/threonine protein kinase
VQIRLSHFFYEVQWPVILMEVCELGSLEDLVAAYRVKGEDVPESLVAMVLVHLSQALYELHSGNVLHRDVKARPTPRSE